MVDLKTIQTPHIAQQKHKFMSVAKLANSQPTFVNYEKEVHKTKNRLVISHFHLIVSNRTGRALTETCKMKKNGQKIGPQPMKTPSVLVKDFDSNHSHYHSPTAIGFNNIIIIFHFYSAHIHYLSEALYKIISYTTIIKINSEIKKLKTQRVTLIKSNKKEGLKSFLK